MAADGDPQSELDAETQDILDSIGASAADLASHDGDITDLATIWNVRPGEPRHDLRQAALLAGLTVEQIRAVRRAGGLPAIPTEADIAISDREVQMLQGFALGAEVFGETAVLQIARVIGASALRVADTVTSSFLVNLERKLPDLHPNTVAQANIDATAMLPIVTDAIDVFLRHHIITSRRSHEGVDSTHQFEVRTMTVGFADIVGSTRLTQSLSLGEMGSLLADFEGQASEVITENGGRLVKLIGDEVMFAAPTANDAMIISSFLHEIPERLPGLPGLRVGLATGDVMHREGDLFGPTVNRAARIVGECLPNRTLADTATKDATDVVATNPVLWASIGRTRLRGFEDKIELWAVSRSAEAD